MKKYLDNNEWVDKVGYCRAVKKGNMIFISGTPFKLIRPDYLVEIEAMAVVG